MGEEVRKVVRMEVWGWGGELLQQVGPCWSLLKTLTFRLSEMETLRAKESCNPLSLCKTHSSC